MKNNLTRTQTMPALVLLAGIVFGVVGVLEMVTGRNYGLGIALVAFWLVVALFVGAAIRKHWFGWTSWK
jgi:hypothetical protein